MYGYIYKTTNKINNKVYIGQHKHSCFDTSYYGSGKIILQTIEKYGKENFSVEILVKCDSKEELDKQEFEFVKLYKEKYNRDCYNISTGGTGGDCFYYMSDEEKQQFIDKMTIINKERCNTEDFKRKISQATSKRYADPEERKKHGEKVKIAWSDETLRKEQSDRIKNYYKDKMRDVSFNFKPCVFELNGNKIQFEKQADLFTFLKETYNFTPCFQQKQKLLLDGKRGIPFKPFHKNKYKDLFGMLIYRIDEGVETNCDECSSVESEISTDPKDDAT